MNQLNQFLRRGMGIGVLVALAAVFVIAQQARSTLRGMVKDELGAAIVGATVTIIDPSGTAKTTVTNGEGVYTVSALAPGKYIVIVAAQGFAPSDDAEVDLAAGKRETFD